MRRNDHDVSARIRTTDAAAVRAEVLQLYQGLFAGAACEPMGRAFDHALSLYRGEHPGFHACDTQFHDTQHVLEVTLAMARLMEGYERGRTGGARLSPTLYGVGVISALFHDVGYLRRRSDRRHAHGAEYTLTRVGRSARFVGAYLRGAGLARYASAAAAMVHYTGHERAAEEIRIDGALPRRIGQMLGSADLLAQMSDRCYLEKCRDRLYPEFLLGGLARKTLPDGRVEVVFSSGDDLVRKTPAFFANAMRRLEHDLGRAYDYAESHFEGRNFYTDEMQKNVRHAAAYDATRDARMLRRAPPTTLRPDVQPYPEDLVIW